MGRDGGLATGTPETVPNAGGCPDAGRDAELHQACVALAAEVTEAAAGSSEQVLAWGRLFRLVAPRLEHWCQDDPLLRRAGLTTEDDWRAVLLRTVEHMVGREYGALRSYLEHRGGGEAHETLAPPSFEAWLKQLVCQAARDELDGRLASKRTRPARDARTGERLDGEPSPAPPSVNSAREPKRRSAALRRALAVLDDGQKCALLQRVGGASFDTVAAALQIQEGEARDLVRDAKARLRRALRAGRAGDHHARR